MIRATVAAVLILAAASSASAQGSLTGSASSIMVNPQSMAMIDQSTGDVYIDWKEVSRMASGRGDAAAVPVLVAAAKIMLAVKAGKWKPMPK